MGCCQGAAKDVRQQDHVEIQEAQLADVQVEVGEGANEEAVESLLVAQRGTPFAQFLEQGHMAVVRATYFGECLQQGVPFQDREHIPAEAFIAGTEVVNLWEEYGYAFLVIISYPWLARGHPDPQCYHLPRLVRALEAFRKYHEVKSWRNTRSADRVRELGGGIILDFCAFWQGTRTEEQDRIFKDGLRLINIPYGHRDVTAIKLTSTPETQARRYDDRGWTHFESTVIDGKAPSARHDWGERNVLTCDDAFQPEGDTDTRVLQHLSTAVRRPPLTPLRFREELDVRRRRAEAKGQELFTNGRDSPVILERYDASFEELSRCTKLEYENMDWGAAEAKDLALSLPSFRALTYLNIARNRLNGEAGVALAAALPHCPALRDLRLNDNRLDGQAGVALAAALPRCPALETLNLEDNHLDGQAGVALAGALPHCPTLELLDLSGNQLDGQAGVALAAALPGCPALETLQLGDNYLDGQAGVALAAALPRCPALQWLDLDNNHLDGQAGVALAGALPHCFTLRELYLGGNQLDGQAAEALAAALPHCTALTSLSLWGNNFSGDEEAALRTAWRAAGKEEDGLRL